MHSRVSIGAQAASIAPYSTLSVPPAAPHTRVIESHNIFVILRPRHSSLRPFQHAAVRTVLDIRLALPQKHARWQRVRAVLLAAVFGVEDIYFRGIGRIFPGLELSVCLPEGYTTEKLWRCRLGSRTFAVKVGKAFMWMSLPIS